MELVATKQRRKPVDIPIHPDVGCSYHNKCLTCPLALCRYDLDGGLPEAVRLTESIAAEKRRRAKFADEVGAAICIRAAVAEEFSITVADLVGPKRYTNLVQARWETSLRLRRDLKMNLVAIGAIIHRDHSTVIYGLRQVAAA